MKTRIHNQFIMLIISAIMIISIFTSNCYSKDKLDQDVQQILDKYLVENARNELLTAISVSISLPKEKETRNYAAGKVSNKKDAPLLKKSALFQTGSITKSFASAIILQLEAAGKLNINQTIGKWLPEYPKWKDVTIKSLLNMTSGIPGYIENPEILKKMSEDLGRQWSDKEIADFIYSIPNKTTGWYYSDTNYILSAMIIEKATGSSFSSEIEKRFLSNKKLADTFYLGGPTPQYILDRMPEGYFYGKLLPTLYGKNTEHWNLSVAGAAGAMISTTEDIAHWVRMLYAGNLFPPQQQQELKELVLMSSGHPIKEVTSKNPSGFGLGVGQIYFPDGGGPTWFYEGTTMGYRTYYLFTPCNDIVLSLAMNSSPLLVSKDISDNISLLAKKVYEQILVEQPEYNCKMKNSNKKM